MTKQPNDSWDPLASQRGLSEPEEEDHPIPFMMGLTIGLVLGWGATYAFMMPNWDSAMGRSYAGAPSAAGNDGLGTAVVDGAQVYQARCAACHQAGGTGVPGTFPPLVGSEWLEGSSRSIGAVLINGLTGPITVAGTEYSGMMPPLGGAMSDEEVSAVLGYLVTEFGAAGPALGVENVTTLRSAIDGQGLIIGGEGLAKLAAE